VVAASIPVDPECMEPRAMMTRLAVEDVGHGRTDRIRRGDDECAWTARNLAHDAARDDASKLCCRARVVDA